MSTPLPGLPAAIAGHRLGALRGEVDEGWRVDAWDLAGQACALVLVRPAVAGDPSWVAALERTRAELGRAAIAGVRGPVEVLREGDQIALRVDEVAGESVEAELERRGRIPWGEALARCAAIGGALAGLHARGLAFGGLRAATVVSGAGGIVLCDVGLARNGHGPQGAATMAPEQAGGGAATIASDVYALAALLHQMVTGAPLFSGDLAQVAMLHRFKEPRPLRRIDPAIGASAAAEAVILRALDKSPRRRFGGVDELLVALADASASGAAATGPALLGSGSRHGALAGELGPERTEVAVGGGGGARQAGGFGGPGGGVEAGVERTEVVANVAVPADARGGGAEAAIERTEVAVERSAVSASVAVPPDTRGGGGAGEQGRAGGGAASPAPWGQGSGPPLLVGVGGAQVQTNMSDGTSMATHDEPEVEATALSASPGGAAPWRAAESRAAAPASAASITGGASTSLAGGASSPVEATAQLPPLAAPAPPASEATALLPPLPDPSALAAERTALIPGFGGAYLSEGPASTATPAGASTAPEARVVASGSPASAALARRPGGGLAAGSGGLRSLRRGLGRARGLVGRVRGLRGRFLAALRRIGRLFDRLRAG
ncbi:MAG: hypothetical protein H6711_26760 [Myxococcales bacterium]|nr:hypothetical protein [Myxococcales bacterium]